VQATAAYLNTALSMKGTIYRSYLSKLI